MQSYYLVRLGVQGVHVQECLAGGFIGVNYEIHEDLTGKLPEDWRPFNKHYIPMYLANVPGKTKVAAGLACGTLWQVAKGLHVGDLVLSPDGSGQYRVGRVSGDYHYVLNGVLPHRRSVEWLPVTIDRESMSDTLRRSTNTGGTLANITRFGPEIDSLLGDEPLGPELMASDPTVEDPTVFALEKHLEDFLVSNWSQTELGKRYKIYEVDGEVVGQQFPTDTGPMDILAISHDSKELLVVELKRGRASDNVIGQVQRYMGYALQDLAEPGQTVRGVIIALEDDVRIRRALAVASNIDFYRYEVAFKLHKSGDPQPV